MSMLVDHLTATAKANAALITMQDRIANLDVREIDGKVVAVASMKGGYTPLLKLAAEIMPVLIDAGFRDFAVEPNYAGSSQYKLIAKQDGVRAEWSGLYAPEKQTES